MNVNHEAKPVLWTTQYDQFQLDERNRPIDPRKVTRIINSIQLRGNFLPNYPIIVDESGIVLDGQHRLRAAQALSLPLYFIQDTAEMGIINVAETARNTSPWQIDNFLNFHARGGNENYQLIQEFLARHPNITPGGLLSILRARQSQHDTFYKGELDITPEEWKMAADIANLAARLQPYIPALYRRRGVLIALKRMYQHAAFNPDQLVEQFATKGLTIHRQAEASDYLHELEYVYNFGKSANRIHFTG